MPDWEQSGEAKHRDEAECTSALSASKEGRSVLTSRDGRSYV